ncbi:MAG: DUF86 domain-containing protein [Dehalococcoidia bacterium]|nr:DUF86 domain-containing protein [Dehalococcoidia bacterium]
MQRDPRVYLWDALAAADHIIDFTRGRNRQDLEDDLLLRSGVERQFEIIGEALNQLTHVSPEVARQVPELARIIAFRNILVHGYAIVNNDTVWGVVQDDLPALQDILRRLLDEA